MEWCFLTGKSASFGPLPSKEDGYLVISAPCGEYEVSGTLAASSVVWSAGALEAALGDWAQYADHLHVLAAVARREWNLGGRLKLNTHNLDAVLASIVVPKTPYEKIDLIIRFLARESEWVGAEIQIRTSDDFPIAVARHAGEFGALLRMAFQLGYIETPEGVDLDFVRSFDYRWCEFCRLTLDGWKRAEELRQTGRDSRQAFVATWYDNSMVGAYVDGIAPALDATGWNPLSRSTK